MSEQEQHRYRVNRDREVNMFGELSHANHVILENSRRENDGCFHEFLSSILISAFKFEALLNHLGTKLLPYWSEMDYLRVENKMNVLCSHLEQIIDKGRRPFQTITELFRFRNAVAHGRPESLSERERLESGNLEEIRRKQPLTDWEKLCTIEFAERADADTEEIAAQLWTAANLPKEELHSRCHEYSIKRDLST